MLAAVGKLAGAHTLRHASAWLSSSFAAAGSESPRLRPDEARRSDPQGLWCCSWCEMEAIGAEHGVVRRSALQLVVVEAVCDGVVPTRNEKVVGSIPTGGSTVTRGWVR